MGSGRNDEWRVLMEATLVPPAERLPTSDSRRPEQRPLESTAPTSPTHSVQPKRD